MPPQAPRRPLHRLTIAVLVATFCALGAGQYAAARWWYGSTVAAAEHRDGRSRARLAERTLATQLESLRRTAHDNGKWDDTYQFIKGRNPGYFGANWDPDTFANLSIDVVAFVAADGRVVRILEYDPYARRYLKPAAALLAAVGRDGPLLLHLARGATAAGLALIGGEVYAWGGAPVLRSSGAGDIAGTLLVLRSMGASFEGTLSELADARVTLEVLPDADPVPPGPEDPLFDDGDPTTLDMRFLAGRTADGHAVAVRVLSARPVHAAAASAARALLWSTIAAGLLIAALAVVYFERRLLQPLRLMSARLVEIGRAGDPAARLKPHRHADEIGTVASAANEMLAELEDAKRGADAARDAALAASRVKSEFLARMSHEIRTPMNGVLGMTELLERTELTARQRKYCDTIHRSAASLLEIINDILDFSKIEARRLELQAIDFDVASLVEDAAELLSSRTHGRDLELIVAVRPAVPPIVHVDPLRLRQVLTNLIGNALKFTEHGEVVVTVDSGPVADGRATLEFTVADTGIGIAPGALGRLFEPFAQADASTTRRYGGTGLGLAIARQLVELMGGAMSVTSEPGRGSVFRVSLSCEVPALVGDDAERPPLLQGLRVLVGDDNATGRAVLAEALAAAGAVVTTAVDAVEVDTALAAADARPDVVLLDHRLVSRIARRGTLGVPVITMAPTGDGGNGPEPGSDGGVAGYLTKPVRRSLLLATIARVTGRGADLDTATFLASVGLSAAGERLGLKVLVVEDNPVNQAVASGMLEALGCRVSLAGHGIEALECTARGGIDVVLMDCQMPLMDGITATQRLREREVAAHAARLPVIGVSAHAMQGAREECLLAGMNDFVAKPYTMAELARALRRHARRRPAEEAGAGAAQPRAASGTNGRGSGPT
jgi:signal transduction histidine kinase/DNA-binding response OmpR family regulator